jgi:2-amino-4-deoxychorismate synthase
MTRSAGRDLLDRVTDCEPQAFALLHRPGTAPGIVDIIAGEASALGSLADLPAAASPVAEIPEDGRLPAGAPSTGTVTHELLVLIPYRQIAERGFAAPDDGVPLIAISVSEQATASVTDVCARIPDVPVTLEGGRFDVEDTEYANIVRKIIADEIGTGEGANFVIKRSFIANISDYSPSCALTFFRHLLESEQGAYWTFIIHTGEYTLVGATPERHITVENGTAVMNPISGTYLYPDTGPTVPGVMEFLADGKETEELYMVLDEELKMMARICDAGGSIAGPYLREMAQLAHTEYFIEGQTSRDVRAIFRETMFAPTVTGSPLASAARVISRYEPEGRGYYSGVAAVIGKDGSGRHALDSAILIRTADIDSGGRLRISVGATLVRHSDPASEAAETRAKAAGLLHALDAASGNKSLAQHPQVRSALQRRNDTLAAYWLKDWRARACQVPELSGAKVLVVDAEDSFTAMLGQQLRSLGLSVTTRRFDEPFDTWAHHLMVLGPGPGDPRAASDPKIKRLRTLLLNSLAARTPLLAVCLSHQVLSTLLGFHVYRRESPNQGVQREIDLFGRPERVGFYNTFAARSSEDRKEIQGLGPLEICRDRETREIHAIRGPHFGSMQFHAESVLTVNGPQILAAEVRRVLER